MGDLSPNKDSIKTLFLDVGFDLVGITSPDNSDRENLLNTWISKGYNAEMDYFKKNSALRIGKELPFKNAKNIIIVGINYYSANRNKHFSIYLKSKDYHTILKEKLYTVADQIKKLYPFFEHKPIVDSFPAMEVALAKKAGLGFVGKNTLLINKKIGSFMFLGGLYTNLDLPLDNYKGSKEAFFECGECNKCIDACPSQAFVKPGVIDSRKCISYWTTAHPGPNINLKVVKSIKPYAYGCDICQLVCPYNEKIKESSIPSLYPNKTLNELHELAKNSFRKNFGKTSINYMGKKRFLRNINTLKKCLKSSSIN